MIQSNNSALNHLALLKVIARQGSKIILIQSFFSIHGRKMYAM